MHDIIQHVADSFLVVYLDDVDSNAYLFLISVRVLVGHAGLG